jgi:hypothetical protein
MADSQTVDFYSLLQYFNASSFDYLSLEHAGRSLRLCRAPAVLAAPLQSSSVGVIDCAPGRAAWPHVGDQVRAGEPLFAVRRFKTVVRVDAPAAGTIACLSVAPGEFVEFGQALATIEST